MFIGLGHSSISSFLVTSSLSNFCLWLFSWLFSFCSSSNCCSPHPSFCWRLFLAAWCPPLAWAHLFSHHYLPKARKALSPALSLALPTSHISNFLQAFPCEYPAHLLDSSAPNWIQYIYLTPDCLLFFFSHCGQQLEHFFATSQAKTSRVLLIFFNSSVEI